MSGLSLLAFLAAAANGLVAGVSFEVAAVKLPARRRIGSVAYAQFARGADLGNGKVVYPALAIVTALLTFAATLVAYLHLAGSAITWRSASPRSAPFSTSRQPPRLPRSC